MPTEPRRMAFVRHRADEVVAVMEELAAARAGWVNFEPDVHPDDVPPSGSGLFAIFSGRGPDVPLATWTAPSPPPRRGKGRPQPAMIGLQHGAGTRARGRLADVGHPVPDGWVVMQDHARRGLVVAVPDDASPRAVLDWLLTAAAALSPVPVHAAWHALVYRP